MRFLKFIFLLICLSVSYFKVFSQEKSDSSVGNYTLKVLIQDEKGKNLEGISVFVNSTSNLQITDANGLSLFSLPGNKKYEIIVQDPQLKSLQKSVFLDRDKTLTFSIKKINVLDEVTIKSKTDDFGIRQLYALEDGGLYEGKKTEVINIQNIISNKAGNNARQAYSKIPSLNIWESDAAGIQLDIGGRGLDPKRTSNFNTRQNGYDISADALGYPESYYTPPLQAIKQIELVRGSGALQYGSQFGGLLNFKLKKGETDKAFHLESENTYGAFNFINTFNSIHGQYKKLNHYSYVQYKKGDGWRPNSEFNQFGAYSNLEFTINEKFKISGAFSYMDYLSKQAGGLTDEQFLEDPRQSTRTRNWFKVNWAVPALTLEYKFSPNVKLYSRTFGLIGQRSSLGLLTTPNQKDENTEENPFLNRDLINGQFNNIGNETRLTLNYYTKKDLYNSVLIGTRIFKGFTNFSQSLGTTGIDADFTKVEVASDGRRKSDFDFPSTNIALFVESIFRFNSNFSVIPGLRFEHINTSSSGTLITPVRINAFGDVEEQSKFLQDNKDRNILLFGLGFSKKFGEKYELYGNATRNYRAINFTDVQIQTNTQLVDPSIEDEKGYNFDFGIRKLNYKNFFIEAGFFLTQYNNRIGEILDDGLRVRTNIGDGRIFGFEIFFETDLIKLLRKNSSHRLAYFVNGSINRGLYIDINERSAGVVRSGKKIENVPEYNFKTGLTYSYKKFSSSVQMTLVGEQFSDAQNTTVVISPLAETTGVFGEIPAYQVLDLSIKYNISKHFIISSSVNNLTDQSYFTRRATAYPGPGIIPALGRTWNLTLKVKI